LFFKASADSGKTFGSKLDLSNSKGIVSNDASIAASGNNVYLAGGKGIRQQMNLS
jgi:urease alpha subunit